MTVTVRPANLEVERESLFGPLERNLPDLAHRRRFDWLYRANPAGTAWSWFACDLGTQNIVGVASVFPRAFWIGGRVERCGQVGDFAVDPTHRSLGPAVMLQRATFQPVDRGLLTFCYDCPPHDQGMATFRRLGIEAICRTRHYVRPLSAKRQIESRMGRGVVAKAITAVTNLALAAKSHRRYAEPGVEIEEYNGLFGDEFSALDRDTGGPEVVRSRRSAEDLNWRYRDDPLHSYRVLTARRRGELLAFIVFATAATDTLVLDLFGHLSCGIAVALIDATATTARSAGAETLRMTIGEDVAGGQTMGRAGFWRRGEGPRVVPYAGRDAQARAVLLRPTAWRLRQIDLLA
jgi:GNAT superfamily N-acetyltransferase